MRRVRIGQVWRRDGTGETFLVTKLYPEALATMAVLRKTGAETEIILRVKVERAGERQVLPGFSLTREFEDS